MKKRLLKTDKHRRYYYHLTSHALGDAVTLIPTEGEHRAEDEPEGKRLCVSNTPAKCFIAIPLWVHNNYYLYRTCRKITAKYPYGIEDMHVTGEKWIMRPTKFKLIQQWEADSEDLENIIFGIIKKCEINCGAGNKEALERARDARWLLTRHPSIRAAYRK